MSKRLHERSPAEIERRIHETQSEMDTTLEALRERISPRELLGQSLGYIRHSGADVGQNLMGQIRSNPLPVVLLAASLGWLMMAGRQGERQTAVRKGRSDIGGEPGGEIGGELGGEEITGGRGGPSGEAFRETDARTISQYGNVFKALARVRPRIDETGQDFSNRLYPAIAEALDLRQESSESPDMFRERVERAFDDLSSRAQEAQHKISEQAQQSWQQTREGVRHMAGAAAQQARRVTRQASDLYSDYPLIAGGVAFAMGALLGAAVPSTRQEKEMFGGAGEELRETAGSYAREAARAAGDVAGRATGAAREAGGGGQGQGQGQEWSEAGARDIAERLRRGEEAVEATTREEMERLAGGGPSGRHGSGRS